MKRISTLGPIRVVHNGLHFELPQSKVVCHGYARTCECPTCLSRAAKKQRTAFPWEEDYRAA